MPISALFKLVYRFGFTREGSVGALATILAWSQVAPGELEAVGAPSFWDAGATMTEDAWRKILAHLAFPVIARSGPWATNDSIRPLSDLPIEMIQQAWATLRSHLLLERDPSVSARETAEGLLAAYLEHTGRIDEPKPFAAMMEAALALKSEDPIYCHGDETAQFALFWANDGRAVHVDLVNRDLGRVLAMLALASRSSIRIGVANSEDGVREDFRGDRALIMPPFGALAAAQGSVRLSSSSWSANSTLADRLFAAPISTAAVVVPDGFLFRTTSSEQALKQRLIDEFGLRAVVSLRKGLLSGGGQYSLLILQRGERPRSNIGFLDGRRSTNAHADSKTAADDEFIGQLALGDNSPRVRWVQSAVVEDNAYNLSVDRYVRSPEHERTFLALERCELVRLSDVADISRPPALSPEKDLVDGLVIREVANSDIADGIVAKPAKQILADKQTFTKGKRAFLAPGDILFSVKGRVGVVGRVPEEKPPESYEPWIAGQSFVVLKLNPKGPLINPAVLVAFLQSEYGESQIATKAGGATVPSIQIADVKALNIPLLARETQAEIVTRLTNRATLLRVRKELDQRISDATHSLWTGIIEDST